MHQSDWECPRCGANVFASKDACFKCREVKSLDGIGGRKAKFSTQPKSTVPKEQQALAVVDFCTADI